MGVDNLTMRPGKKSYVGSVRALVPEAMLDIGKQSQGSGGKRGERKEERCKERVRGK